jgi:16S rRNA (cytidine1402-2'-O)-methyltransferase
VSGPGRLWLVPVTLGEQLPEAVLPSTTLAAARSAHHVIAESARSARAFLKAVGHPQSIASIDIRELDPQVDADTLLQPVIAGADAVLVSEAGAPCVADPGSRLVARAHALGIAVKPMVGPSALLLGLMASGLEGQRFAFQGYLPVERPALEDALRTLELESARGQSTQLWIEAPYRNERMLSIACDVLRADTRLCVACDLTLPAEWIRTRTIAGWKADAAAARTPSLDRRPAIFLMLAANATGPMTRTPNPGPRQTRHRNASRSARRSSPGR